MRGPTLLRASSDEAQASVQQPRAVFIGGSGQSGVSTLNGLLGRHPGILTCHLETNIVLAPNGVMDVVNAISSAYSPQRLEVALHEFDRLLHHHLCSPRSYPYSGFDLAGFFGKKHYHQSVELFITELGVIRHRGDGMTVGAGARIGNAHLPFKLKGLRLPARVGRERTYLYQAGRLSEVGALAAARRFLDRLFGDKARAEGKLAWCEQTTNNQQFADFLLRMAPDCLYINVTRDPLDLAVAHRAQAWAAPNFTRVCESLRDLLARWLEVRGRLPESSFVEVRFEDLVGQSEVELARVCLAIGVEPSTQRQGWTPSPVAPMRSRLAGADLDVYRRVLGATAEALGYAVP
ncbi:MAG TPA: sulfotransferase [Candidatus Micrarchaeaceae archaeon]|nr:sulfotransferase [Candidatus Micrarchaeaceae archaeon]